MILRRRLISIPCSRYSSSLLDIPEGTKSGLDSVEGSSSSSTLLEECSKSTKTKIVSRLSERHRLIAEGRLPPISYEWEKELWAKRERFGHFGLESGVDPGELWPTVEEIQEEEAIGWYRKYGDVLRAVQNAKEAERAAAIARLKAVAALEGKYPAMLKEFLESRKEVAPVKTKQELEEEQQAHDMIEYYGYEVARDDPRFPILYEKMLEAKKKAAKLAEKEELSKKKRLSRKKEKEMRGKEKAEEKEKEKEKEEKKEEEEENA